MDFLSKWINWYVWVHKRVFMKKNVQKTQKRAKVDTQKSKNDRALKDVPLKYQ